jgi:23S rRNA pseudouridine2605 synthase
MEERLQKIIARAGIASRRHAEEMIASGLVTLNGKTVTELGTKADPARDHIKVSGRLIHLDSHPVYLLLNKPPEVVSTMSDPEGRHSLRDLLHGVQERVFPVGRLEYHAAGAILLTNDGELANTILQSHHIPQTWQLKLQRLLTFEEIEQLSRITGSRITRLKGAEAAWYEVTLTESRRDQLRNRLFQTGHPVEKMKRVAIGGIELGRLRPGERRELSAGEVASLRRAAAGESVAPAKSSTPPPPSFVQRPSIKSSAPARPRFFRSGERGNRGARPAAGGGRGPRGAKPGWKSRGSRPEKPAWKSGGSQGPRKEGRPKRNSQGRRNDRNNRPRPR